MHRKDLLLHEKDREYTKIFASVIKELNNKLKHSNIDCSKSGTCFHAIVIIKNVYYTINMGNSKSLIIRGGDHHPSESIELTVCHDLSNLKEKERISKVTKDLRKLKPYTGSEIGELPV